MRIHHLNCGTMHPFGGRRMVNGDGEWDEPALMVCHCLLVEGAEGLLLVDSGFGLADTRDRRERVEYPFMVFGAPRLDPEETAVRQLGRLGFRAEDVRHVVLTHLDLDHAGGIPDFPRAQVHVLEEEYRAAMTRRTFSECRRYHPCIWAHKPDWVRHARGGETWFGLESAGRVEGFSVEVLLIPAPGHSRGHSAVAVRSDAGWLLHAGDAYNARAELAAEPRPSLGMQVFQAFIETDRSARLVSQARLRELARRPPQELRVFCGHDPAEFERLRANTWF